MDIIYTILQPPGAVIHLSDASNITPTDFASQKIKAYSSLLHQLDVSLSPDASAVRSNAKGARQVIHRDVQNKINLLVRNREVLSITHWDAGQIVVVNCERVGPARDETARIDDLETSDLPLKVFVEVHSREVGGRGMSADVEPVEYLFSRYSEMAVHKGEGIRRSDISFAEHFNIIRSLLLECHDATTDETLDSAVRRLRSNIMVSSHQKMYKRLEMGQSRRGRDFYDLMTIDPMLPQFRRKDIPVVDVLQRKPTAAQLAMFESFADSVSYPALAEKKADKPVYSRSNRALLHRMLSLYLQRTETALKTLRSSIRLEKLTNVSQRAADIKPLVEEACVQVQKFELLCGGL